MNCPQCGSPLDNETVYCGNCGAKVALRKRHFCVKCGAEIYEDGTVCENCKNKEAGTRKPLNKKMIVIAAAAIALIVFIAIKAITCNKNTKPSNQPSSSQTQHVSNTEVPDNMIKVINVVGKSYNDAFAELQGLGFTNIVSNIGQEDENREWIVVNQNYYNGQWRLPDDKIELTCAYKCKLDLLISSEANLLFSIYDMSVSLDGEEIGSVSNGETFSYSCEVYNGEHELFICKHGEDEPNCRRTIEVSEDLNYKCDVSHGADKIELKNEVINLTADLFMPDVTGMALSDAFAALQAKGFTNLREEPHGSIWDRNNWIVITQSITAGTTIGLNDYIQLDCIKLDEYFNNEYVGKSVGEIQALAEAHGFSVVFEDEHWNNLNDRVAAMDADEKENWIATSARQYGGAEKTACVTIKYTGETTTSQTPNTTPEADSSVYYSTNDHDEAKEGRSGVYAYKKHLSNYDIYYIIDFDDGYVYYFCEGNGDSSCERMMIESGTLNDVLIIAEEDGDDVVHYGLHFKWKNNPSTLIVEDERGNEYDYNPTYLTDALRLRDKKTMFGY